nr:MAG TPA: hypothetical protein [Caudoviricetes sp.]
MTLLQCHYSKCKIINKKLHGKIFRKNFLEIFWYNKKSMSINEIKMNPLLVKKK